MKLKYLFTAVCLIISLSFVSGQNYHLGLRFGYSQSTLEADTDPLISLNDRQAFTFAFTHNVTFDRSPLGFSIETGYVLKGVRINDAGNDYRLHYLNFPLLLDIYPTDGLRLSVGPEISFLADARSRTTDSTSVTLKNTFDKRWELSGTIGASYALDFYIDIGARYSRGFTKYPNLDAVLNRREQYNSYFQVYLVIKLAN